MHLFIVTGIPMIIAILLLGCLSYVELRKPSPIALGSALPKFDAVSVDEIHGYCKTRDDQIASPAHLRRQTDRNQATVIRRYIAQMTRNTKLFQQVARFEVLKIDPAKSSFDYETRETLALRLIEEANAVRWLLVKGQLDITKRKLGGEGVRRQAVETLLKLTGEYKQLEQDAVAWVGMGADACYQEMLIERLGLSNWGLIDGGSLAPVE
jgi:hypothetical protein